MRYTKLTCARVTLNRRLIYHTLRKDQVNFKIYDIITVFTKMLRSKGNQVTKFGQLIEYNMRNIFLEKS